MLCKLYPTVKKNNEDIPSPLYQELYKITKDRNNSILLYEFFKSSEFLKEHQNIALDEFKEPLISEILPFINIEKVQSVDAKMKNKEKELNDFSKNKSTIDVAKKVVEFNRKNKDFVAKIENFSNNSDRVIVKKREKVDNGFIKDLEASTLLYDKISNFLKSIGLEINILDSNIEGIENGLIVPSAIDGLVDGLYGVINIANNKAGFDALSEEFSHFIIECLKSDPIIQRLESRMTESVIRKVLGKDYDTELNYYKSKGREDLMAREALGRILQSVLKKDTIDALDENKINKSLFQRFIDKISNFINKYFFKTKESDIDNIIKEVFTELDYIQKTVFKNPRGIEERLPYFKEFGDSLANAKNAKDELLKVSERAALHLGKHIDFYKDRQSKTNLFDEKEIGMQKKLLFHIKNENYLEALNSYIKDALELLRESQDTLKDVNEKFKTDSSYHIGKSARSLRAVKNFTDSFKDPVLQIIQLSSDILSNRIDLSNEYKDQTEYFSQLLSTATMVHSLIIQTEATYFSLSRDLLESFYKPFFDEDGALKTDMKLSGFGKKIYLTDILEYSMGDISLFERSAMAADDSRDLFISMVGHAIQNQQEEIRLEVLKMEREIAEMDAIYKAQTGSNDVSFIYELDENGMTNGFLIGEVDYNAFNKEVNEKKIELKKRIDSEEINEETAKEIFENWMLTIKVKKPRKVEYYKNGQKVIKTRQEYVPNKNLFPSKALNRLTKAQREYYDKYMQIKTRLDFMLPESKVEEQRAIQRMISDTQEAIQTGVVNVNDRISKVLGNLENLFSPNENDKEDFGENNINEETKIAGEKVKHIKTNFDKSVMMKVPIYYTNLLPQEKRYMISRDATSSLAEYAIMAINYNGMNKIVDVMEITKDHARKRKIKRTQGVNQVVEKIKFLGKNLGNLESEISAEGSNITKRIDSLIETQVYGKSKIEGFNFSIKDKKISLEKTIDNVINFTTWSMLGYNPFTGINNVVVGAYQTFVEANGNEFFSKSDYMSAVSEYFRLMPDLLSELYDNTICSKLGLLSEAFDAEQNWKNKIKDKDFHRGVISKTLKIGGASFMMNMGEHMMKNVPLIAYLKNTQVLNANNQKVSLYDAIDTKVFYSNGIKVGGELFFKNGYKNLDGSPITEETIKKITLKVRKINHELHGIYNAEDAMELKRYGMARLFLMYRNFIIPTLNKRYRGFSSIFRGNRGYVPEYSFQQEMFKEGFYVTTIKYLLHFMGVKAFVRDQKYKFKELSATEQANVRRTIMEITLLLAILFLTKFMGTPFDDDDDEKEVTWKLRAAQYFINRLELEAWFPVRLITNGSKMLVSPTPVVSVLEKTIKIVESIGDDELLKTGPYKGHTKLYASTMRALPIVPAVKDFFEIHKADKRFKIFQ